MVGPGVVRTVVVAALQGMGCGFVSERHWRRRIMLVVVGQARTGSSDQIVVDLYRRCK